MKVIKNIIIILFTIILLSGIGGAGYYDTSYLHYKDIEIKGEDGTGTDYQVKLEIGDSAGGDFHLNGRCLNFSQDIIITNDDGITLLDFWIEDIAVNPIIIWVKVDNNLGSNQTIRVYYRKSGATTNSDIVTTFLFGDDFNDNSIDTAKWDVTANVVESDGNITITGQNAYRYTISDNRFGTNTALKMKASAGFGGYGNNQGLSYGHSTPGTYGFTTDYPVANSYHTRYSGGTVENIGNTYTGLHIWEIIRNTETSTIYKIDDNVVQTKGSSSTTTYNILLSAYGNGIPIVADWVFVRKYNNPEPTFARAGTEQSYAGSIYYNISNPYNHTIESDSTIIANRSIITSDNINWTAAAISTDVQMVVTNYNLSQTIISNFSLYSSNLNWLKITNLTAGKTYQLYNTTLIETITSNAYGEINYTTNLIPDNYYIILYVLPPPPPSTSTTSIKTSDKDIKAIYYPMMIILLIFIMIGGMKYVFNK